MKVMLGWDMNFSIWVSSLTVGVYVALGGLFSAIFNEVVQFFLIWFGALLIPIFGLIETGRLVGHGGAHPQNFPGQDFTHMWSTMGSFQDNPMGVQWIGIVFGLGCDDLDGLLDHRLPGGAARTAAKDLRAAKLAPIIGSFFKMAVPFIVILPGLLGLAVLTDHAGNLIHLVPAERESGSPASIVMMRSCR